MTTINSVSPNIRDFLLSRNLILANTIVENGFAGQANGLGLVAQVSTGNESISEQPTLSDLGDAYRDLNLVKNPYRTENNLEIEITDDNAQNIGNLPFSSQPVEYGSNSNISSNLISNSDAFRDLNTANNLYLDENLQTEININQTNLTIQNQLGSYIDENNEIRLAGIGTDSLNVLGAIVNGRGVGITSNGSLEPNFDVRGSIAGRTLSAAGLINDTPIGIIGARELAFAIANNALFNLQEEVELNPVNLINGANFFRENFKITIPLEGGLVSNITETVLGFRRPTSDLDNSSSIFQNENPVNSHLRNINMIKNTGGGQSTQLFNNLNENTFKPGYSVEKNNIEEGITDSNIYFGDIGNGEFIDLINDSEINKVAQSSYDLSTFTDEFDSLDNLSLNGNNTPFTWADTNFNKGASVLINQDAFFNNSKSLLSKTREIFKSDRMKTLTSGRFVKENPSQIQDTVTSSAGAVSSKGSGVIAFSGDLIPETDPENMFCRTWTTFRKYDSIRDLQKHSSLNSYRGIRRNIEDSVLEDNGMPKIAPYASDAIADDVKKFMFSIENLAWADNTPDLAPCELGNGDLTTGTRGRIMWFPPYDIDFTDNTSVNWDSTNFIGRGEPVYTYNNTERIGTLSFKMIADYATYMNDLKNISASNDLYASIVAGCTDFNDNVTSRLTPSEVTEILVNNTVKPEEVVVNTDISFETFSIYFPNDSALVDSSYEDGDGEGLGTTIGEGFTSKLGQSFVDQTDFGLNKPFFEPGGFSERLRDFLRDECPACSVEIRGFASTQGRTTSNNTLSDARADAIRNYFLENIIEANDPNRTKRFKLVIGQGETGPQLTDTDRRDSEGAKRARKVDIVIQYDSNLDEEIQNVKPKEPVAPVNENLVLNNETLSRFIDECAYFEKMEEETPFIYERLTEKFKYFHPAFHSTTPEGLNSRLTFLQQCTRQGPTFTKNKSGEIVEGLEQPNNLAFGRPPVCILRIGDFYHTKIIIDNLNFTYEPLVWDLNPEGIGVQPMIVNVDISFKFIGGSSLKGPINKLQNAISFNYFANTEVYDTRSDTLRPKTQEELRDNPLGTHTIQEGMSVNEINSTVDKSQEQGVAPNSNRPTTDQIERTNQESSKNVGNNNTNVQERPKTQEEIINSIQIFDVELIDDGSNEFSFKYSYKGNTIYNSEDKINSSFRVDFNLTNNLGANLNIFTTTLTSGNNGTEVSSGAFSLLQGSSSNLVFTELEDLNSDLKQVFDLVKESQNTPNQYLMSVKIGKIRKTVPFTIDD